MSKTKAKGLSSDHGELEHQMQTGKGKLKMKLNSRADNPEFSRAEQKRSASFT